MEPNLVERQDGLPPLATLSIQGGLTTMLELQWGPPAPIHLSLLGLTFDAGGRKAEDTAVLLDTQRSLARYRTDIPEFLSSMSRTLLKNAGVPSETAER
ncbi:hypothetical protein ACTXT7_010191 [Hymenolepis weldensis]